MKLNDEAAVPYLEHAVEIDQNFATAYATLGVVYSNLTQMKKSSECLQKAYELRERASERKGSTFLRITMANLRGKSPSKSKFTKNGIVRTLATLSRSTICPWSTSGLVSLKKL